MFIRTSSCWASSPLSPGSLTYRTRQLGSSVRHLTRNSCADAKVVTPTPADRSRLATDSRIDTSSSTTYTRECVSRIEHLVPLRSTVARKRSMGPRLNAHHTYV